MKSVSSRSAMARGSAEELLEEAKRRTVLFVIVVLTIAYCMSLTSDSVLINIPIAILVLAVARRVSLEVVIRWRSPSDLSPSQYFGKRLSTKDPLVSSAPSSTKWRSKIDSPPVEAAIDEFTHRIVGEFVTDLWYSSVTPDKEVPQEIQVIINSVIGEISVRAKQVNLINLLTRDVVNVISSHLELYREIQDSIGAQHFGTLSSEERDEKIKEFLMTTKKLHPAVISLETERQVLQKLMGGVLAIALRPEDANCKLVRCLARELLACSVMRPVMNFASPRFINEIVETMTLRHEVHQSQPVSSSSLEEAPPLIDSSISQPAVRSVSGVELAEVGAIEDISFAEDTGKVIYSSKANAVNMDPGNVYTSRSGDWAHALDAFNQRKTQALAPEHLDNLWAKGRNYKKKDAKKLVSKSSDLEQLAVMEELPSSSSDVREGMSELKDFRSLKSGEVVSLDNDYYGKSKEQSRVIVVGEDSIGVRNGNEGTLVTRVIHHPLEVPEVYHEENTRKPNHHRRSHSSGGVPDQEKFADMSKKQVSNSPVGYKSKLSCRVIGAHYEKAGSKSFAVYSISVSDAEGQVWVVLRRYRNFEQLHRRLRDMPHYALSLPPKRFLSSNLDSSLVRERCVLLNKYLKDLLSIPSIAELHEVWDFLSAKSQNYAFGESVSIIKTLAVNMDDAVDDVFRQIKGVSEGVMKTASGGLKKNISEGNRGGSVAWNDASISCTYDLPADGSEDEGEDEYGNGWHSDSEVHKKSSRDMLDSSLSDGHSPVESLAESETPEDDPVQEWNPPKLTAPLLNLVDIVFQLEERGWIRRQVLWIAKQVLQLGMGDAIDDWLLTRVQCLRREDVIVSGFKWIQEVLWPDGIFLIKHPKFRAAPPQFSFEEQLEAARRAMVVRELIQDRAPTALVSLVGRKQYKSCAKDIYGFLQSNVCIKQLAYSLLEKLLGAAFPELEDMITELHSTTAATTPSIAS